jgi:hypothetical protein
MTIMQSRDIPRAISRVRKFCFNCRNFFQAQSVLSTTFLSLSDATDQLFMGLIVSAERLQNSEGIMSFLIGLVIVFCHACSIQLNPALASSGGRKASAPPQAILPCITPMLDSFVCLARRVRLSVFQRN